MFSDKELKATIKYSGRKAEDIMEGGIYRSDFTVDNLRDLQTLAVLKNAAEEKLTNQKS